MPLKKYQKKTYQEYLKNTEISFKVVGAKKGLESYQ